jgi:hypothetical protein
MCPGLWTATGKAGVAAELVQGAVVEIDEGLEAGRPGRR